MIWVTRISFGQAFRSWEGSAENNKPPAVRYLHRRSASGSDTVVPSRTTRRRSRQEILPVTIQANWSDISRNSLVISPATAFWAWTSPSPASTRGSENQELRKKSVKSMFSTSSKSFLSSRMRRARTKQGGHKASIPRIHPAS